MADHGIYEPESFSERLRRLLTSDPAHADVFNPLFERLINNDAYLKMLIETMIKEHKHSGDEGDGSKIPLANIEVPQSLGDIVTNKELAEHINERNPHGTRAVDTGAASAQAFDEHKVEDASTSKKGHMQVGEGLRVSNGVVSSYFQYDTTVTLDTPSSYFSDGDTITSVNTNSSDTLQQQCVELLNILMGYSITSLTSFRFVLRTTKRGNIVNQEITVYSNYTVSAGAELMRFTRARSFSSPYAWTEWVVNLTIIAYDGNPNGGFVGMRGWLLYDRTNQKLYKKTTSVTGASSTGWEEIGAPDAPVSPVPSGLISMWSGTVASIPSDWALCDGTNGTPNLVDRFIVGAGGKYALGDTGGADTVKLTTAQLPSHSHGSGTLSTGSGGSHSHTAGTLSASDAGNHQHTSGTLVTNTAGSHTHTIGSEAGADNPSTRKEQFGSSSTRTTSSSGSHSHSITGATSLAGSHTHSISGSTGSGGSHTHSVSGNTATAGSGQTHENRPPYYALAYIMKL